MIRLGSFFDLAWRLRVLLFVMLIGSLAAAQLADQSIGLRVVADACRHLLAMAWEARYYVIAAGLPLALLLLVVCGMCCAQDGLN